MYREHIVCDIIFKLININSEYNFCSKKSLVEELINRRVLLTQLLLNLFIYTVCVDVPKCI